MKRFAVVRNPAFALVQHPSICKLSPNFRAILDCVRMKIFEMLEVIVDNSKRSK